MISLPSVGAVVSGVALNSNATKAKITFDDDCSIVVSVQNKKMTAKIVTSEKKIKSKRSKKISESLNISIPKSKISNMISAPDPKKYKDAAQKVINRSESRLARLAESAMTPDDKMSMMAKEGPINI